MNIFRPDTKFMRAVSLVVDAIEINMLLLLTSLGIITGGAALVAAHDASRRRLDHEGAVARNFFRAFRSNFAQATGLWCVFLPVGAGLVWLWFFDPRDLPLLVTKIGLSVVFVVGSEWVWYLQSRFSNPIHRTLGLTFVFGFTRLATTLALVLLDGLFVALVVFGVRNFPQILFLLGVLGPGSLIMLHIPILERSMRDQIAAGSPKRGESEQSGRHADSPVRTGH